MRHNEPHTDAYFARRRAEGLSVQDTMRCLKHRITNEVCAALMEPELESPALRRLHKLRDESGASLTVIANILGFPRQRLQRVEAGIRADSKPEARATATLAQVRLQTAASRQMGASALVGTTACSDLGGLHPTRLPESATDPSLCTRAE